MDYQATYDAVRSKISNGDIGAAVEDAVRSVDFGHYAERVGTAWEEAAAEQMRPSVLLKPKLSVDGDQWCVLYGDNLQEGVCGFGESPSDAMRDFDESFSAKLKVA